MKFEAAASCMAASKDNGNIKMKNKGFSLIELIVVMAIVALAGTLAWTSINAVFGFEAKKTVQYIYGALEKTKVEQMTKAGDSYLFLYTNNDGVFLDLYENGVKVLNEFEDGNKIGSSKVSVTYKLDGSEKPQTLDSEGIVLAFNRSDGSFKTAGEALELHRENYSSSSERYYISITVSSGSTTRSITLYPNTGKFE